MLQSKCLVIVAMLLGAHLVTGAIAGEPPSVAIRALQEGMVVAWNAGDLHALMAGYASDATILLSGVPPIEGREAIASMSAAGMAAGIKTSSLEPVTTIVDGALAIVRARYSSIVPMKEGSRREAGDLLAVLRLQADGRWLVALESWTRTGSEISSAVPE